MLDEKTRAAILALQQAGHCKRAISRALGISRNAVRMILASNTTKVPSLDRPEKAEPYHDEVVKLVSCCKGNLVRGCLEEVRVQRCEPTNRNRIEGSVPG